MIIRRLVAIVLVLGCKSTHAPTTDPQPPASKPAATYAAPAEHEASGFTPAFEAVIEGRDEAAVRFGWTAPCTVPVRQHSTQKEDGEAPLVLTAHMKLVFERSDEGYTGLLADYTIDEINGVPANAPELAEGVQRLTVAARAGMPHFLVDASGHYRGLSGTERTIEASLSLADPETRAIVEKTMRDPAMRKQLEAKAADFWTSWVELWHRHPLTPGRAQKHPKRLAFFDTTFDTEVELTHRGVVTGAPRLRLLEAREQLEGPEVTRAVLERIRVLAEQTGRPRPPDDAIGALSRKLLIQAIIDPDGAFPHRVRTETTVTVDAKTQVEASDWAFDWPNATGCRSTASR